MILSLPKNDLNEYIFKLLKVYFPKTNCIKQETVPKKIFNLALERLEYCFSKIEISYYKKNKKIFFNHLNSDHMVIFLYFLSNTIWNELKTETIPTKLFYLNKIMHGIDLFYSIKMPDIFMVVHPLGTVIGKANYKNYLVIYQNCTIGSSSGNYPTIGEKVILYSKVSILGKSKILNNVIVSSNSFLMNSLIPKNSIVFGQEPDLVIKKNSNSMISNFFC